MTKPNFLEELLSDDVIIAPPETITFINSIDGMADAGLAAGAVVYAKLQKRGILNNVGSHLGEKSGTVYASSLSFTTAVMDSTKEISWDYSKNDVNAQIINMVAVVGAAAQGSWALDYISGLLIINKKTTGTFQVITAYKYRSRHKALKDPTKSTAVTPSDSTDLTAIATKGLFVSVPLGVTAVIAFKLVGDSTAQSISLSSDRRIDGQFARVMSTGTTLSGTTIIALGD